MYKLKTLYFDRTDVSERIGINRTSASKECNICYYWYFLDKGFKFQLYVCNGCHDVLMMSMNFSNIVILKNHDVDYRFIINGVITSEAVNLLQKADLNKESGTL